jgi:CBS domain containing-hemolysin-like protein
VTDFGNVGLGRAQMQMQGESMKLATTQVGITVSNAQSSGLTQPAI